MNRIARHIVVVALSLAFLVTAPALLLYTSGYSFSFAKGKIEKTGILSVESVPRGADVTIDGRPARRTTPVVVSRLLPEEYEVRITRPGYYPWQKDLRVESGRTTFAKDVVLIPDTLPRLAARIEGERAAWSDDAKRVAFAVTNDAFTEIAFRDVRTSDETVLARHAADAYDDIELGWSPDGGAIAVSAKDADDEPVLFVYPVARDGEPAAVHETLTGLDGGLPAWRNGRALAVAAGGVYEADPSTGDISPFILDPEIVAVHATADAIWTVRNGGDTLKLLRRVAPDAEATKIADLPKAEHRFVHVGALVVLVDTRRGSGHLVDPKTGAVIEVAPFTDAVPDLTRGSGAVLLCGEFELAILDPLVPAPEVITRTGEPMIDCGWHPLGTYVFYASPTGVTAIEIDPRDRRTTYRIADFDQIDAMVIDPEAETIRFIGAIGSQRGLFERPL